MYTGQCLCGDITFQYDGPLGPIALCHCSQCRLGHGSAFSASAPVQRVRFRFLTGEDKVSEYQTSPGRHRAFCSHCGSPLYNRSDAIPGILRLRLSLIREPLDKGPAQHIHVASKADWYEITDDLPRFDKTERTHDPH